MCWHAWCIRCWGLNPGIPSCMQSHHLTDWATSTGLWVCMVFKHFSFIYFVCVRMYMHDDVCACHMCVTVCRCQRTQLPGVRSVLPLCGARGLNSGYQVWLQASFLMEPSYQSTSRESWSGFQEPWWSPRRIFVYMKEKVVLYAQRYITPSLPLLTTDRKLFRGRPHRVGV